MKISIVFTVMLVTIFFICHMSTSVSAAKANEPAPELKAANHTNSKEIKNKEIDMINVKCSLFLY